MVQFEQDLLEDLQAAFEHLDLQTQILEQEDGSSLLQVLTKKQGKIGQDVLVELFFTQVTDQDERDPYSVLKLCATVFTDIPAENMDEMDKACSYHNRYMMTGAFSTLHEKNVLYCKDSMVLRHSYDPRTCISLGVDAFLVLSSMVEAAIDGFAVVGRGMCDTAEAVRREML